jgi:hypothetical protein
MSETPKMMPKQMASTKTDATVVMALLRTN